MPSVEYDELTVARSDRDGALRVTRMTGTSTLPTAYPQLWDLGAVQVTESEHLVVLSDPDATVCLVLHAEYTADEVDRYGEDLIDGSPVLRHEGMHLVMMLTHVGASPPLWASEGLAGWLEVRGDDEPRDDLVWWYDALLRGGGLPTELPPSLALAFHSDVGLAVERHYAESAMLFRYAEGAHGYDATLALGTELHAIGLWAEEKEKVGEAMEQHLGVGLEQFLADWLSWVAQELPEAGD